MIKLKLDFWFNKTDFCAQSLIFFLKKKTGAKVSSLCNWSCNFFRLGSIHQDLGICFAYLYCSAYVVPYIEQMLMLYVAGRSWSVSGFYFYFESSFKCIHFCACELHFKSFHYTLNLLYLLSSFASPRAGDKSKNKT
jgi:hypothetical protein